MTFFSAAVIGRPAIEPAATVVAIETSPEVDEHCPTQRESRWSARALTLCLRATEPKLTNSGETPRFRFSMRDSRDDLGKSLIFPGCSGVAAHAHARSAFAIPRVAREPRAAAQMVGDHGQGIEAPEQAAVDLDRRHAEHAAC